MHWAKGVTWEAYVLSSVHIIHFAQKHRYFQKLEEHGHHGSAPVNMDADQVFMNQPTLQITTLASSCTYRAKTLQITGVVVYLSSQFLHRSSRFAQALRGGGLGERKREIDRRARQQARAHSSPDSHPEGQYRTTLHRGPAPCVFLRLDALAADSPRRRRQ